MDFFYTGANSNFAWCWLQATLRCWLLGFILCSILLFICSIEIVWLSYVNPGIKAYFRSIQHNRRQPLKSKTIKRASQPNMTVLFKFLPHEILNKPKPAPTIRIYSQAPHEIFTLKPTEKSTTSPKPVTTIHACLWSLNPQPTNQKKKKKEEEGDPHKPISHQTKNRGVWKSTRASNGIRPPRTTYANSQLTPLPPCHFMLHRFHRAPICTIEHCRQWPPVSPYHFSPIDSSAAHDCSATSLLFSFFCF